MKHRVIEENMENSHNQNNPTQEPLSQKGGLRTMPFVIVNESFERVASYGLMPNMILYFINEYNMKSATGTSILSLWSSMSAFLSIFGAFISDSYLGRFRVIAMGSIISLFGMILLWLTTMIPQAKPVPCNSSHIGCENATLAQLAILLSSLGFMSIGAGCIIPCSIAFGADQLVRKDNFEKNERVLDIYFNWYYATTGLSAVVALTVVVYIQDHFGWQVGFGIPAILMLLSTSFFLVGSSLYVKVKAHESLFTGFVQVLVAAFKNRHLTFPSDRLYYQSKDSNLVKPSDNLRFLNKACIVRNPEESLNSDGSVSNPWELCTIDQVEELKSIIRVVPIWSTGVVVYMTINQYSSIAVLQANSMNRHITSNFQIPAGSFTLFAALGSAIWMIFYAQVAIPLLRKNTQQRSITPTLRMGMGILISSIAMSLAAIVEFFRRRTAIQEGLADDPTSVVNMSAMWLIPQFGLSGLAEGSNAVGQIEFYYSHLPKRMSSMAMAIFTLGSAFSGLLWSLIVTIVDGVTKSGGEVSWLSTNLNKGHYDYFYGLLAFLGLLNFVYFLVCIRAYGPCEDERAKASNGREDLMEGLL